MARSIPEFRVTSFQELFTVLSRYKKARWAFRGHSDPSWRLIPKIGRPPFSGVKERSIFEAWKRRAIELVTSSPLDDWDWLAIAQHHGLATRLLDWSFNPLTAAFFAVSQDIDDDAHILVFYANAHVNRRVVIDPLSWSKVTLFKPSAVAGRISRQGGLFTVHGPPTKPLEEALGAGQKLERVVIDRGYRKQLRFDLDYYGVNQVTLFPDLDGLSGYVNWFMINRTYWKDPPELRDADTKPTDGAG
jgi:hypothetical protein